MQEKVQELLEFDQVLHELYSSSSLKSICLSAENILFRNPNLKKKMTLIHIQSLLKEPRIF